MIRSIATIAFTINIILVSLIISKASHHGPHLDENQTTTCEEFSQYARFNPYSVLDSEWMVFFYWGPVQATHFYTFYIPTEKQVLYLRSLMDGFVKEPINWTAKFVLMRDRSNLTSLLVERSERGLYYLYDVPFWGLQKGNLIEPIDLRIKQTGDNRYIGIMACKTEVVHLLSRVSDVPPKKTMQDAVARLGYRGRGGKSYLYQGHHWMPIPEADERLYWSPSKMQRWYLYE